MSIRCSRLSRRSQYGLSLIELMVGIVVGLVMLSAVTSMVVNNLKANRDAVAAAKLNQDLRGALSVIARDLRRANYLPSMQGTLTSNPSAQLANTITLTGCNGACNTLTFGYGGLTKVVDLSGGAVRMKEGTAAAQGLTDNLVSTVTDLSFCFVDTNGNVDPSDDTCAATAPTSYSVTVTGVTEKIRIYLVKITITGRLKNDAAVTKTIEQTVKVRNDAFF